MCDGFDVEGGNVVQLLCGGLGRGSEDEALSLCGELYGEYVGVVPE